MGSAYLPNQSFVEIQAGSTNVVNPVLLLQVNDIVYPNGYRINYNGGFRNFFPTYISTTGIVNIACHTVVYNEDLPDYVLENIKVLVIGT